MRQADVDRIAAAWRALANAPQRTDVLACMLARASDGSIEVFARDSGQIEVREYVGRVTTVFLCPPPVDGRSPLDVIDRGETVRARVERIDRDSRAHRPTVRESRLQAIRDEIPYMSDNDLRDVAQLVETKRRVRRPPRP